MTLIGHVDSLWRYPVKSMRGERIEEAFVGFPGIYGDRLYAFRSSAAPAGFPWLTGREQEHMLLYRPAYRCPESMRLPLNLADVEALAPGLTPVYADPSQRMVDVLTPAGETLAIDDPGLVTHLQTGLRDKHQLTLVQSERALTDCRPVSIFSIHTARQLTAELGVEIDKRRFRANVYISLLSETGFDENNLVGRAVRIGTTAQVAVVDRDNRCKMITLDPETSQPNSEIMRHLARTYGGQAGIYGAVLVQGIIRPGDEVVALCE